MTAVWVTRAQPGADRTAQRLEALGFKALVDPLIVVRRIPAEIDLDDGAALAFTSSNGVEAFTALSPVRERTVFAVGDATAEGARRQGFKDVRSAGGDVGDLAALIVSARPAAVLWLRGRHAAGDLAAALEGAGVPCRSATLYDTPAVETLGPETRSALENRTLAAVLLHSPRATAVCADLLRPFDFSTVVAAGLSPACLAPLADVPFAQRVTAETPNEDALIAALLAALGNPGGRR